MAIIADRYPVIDGVLPCDGKRATEERAVAQALLGLLPAAWSSALRLGDGRGYRLELDDCTGLGGESCWAATLRRLADSAMVPIGRVQLPVPKAALLHGAMVLGWASQGVFVGGGTDGCLLGADEAAMFLRAMTAVALLPDWAQLLAHGTGPARAVGPRSSLRHMASLMGQP